MCVCIATPTWQPGTHGVSLDGVLVLEPQLLVFWYRVTEGTTAHTSVLDQATRARAKLGATPAQMEAWAPTRDIRLEGLA